jgi:hypothetical protein
MSWVLFRRKCTIHNIEIGPDGDQLRGKRGSDCDLPSDLDDLIIG